MKDPNSGPALTWGQRAARALGTALLIAFLVLMIFACSQADLGDLFGSFRGI